MLVLAVHVTIKEGRDSESLAHMYPLQEATRKEPGCLQYIIQRSQTNSRHFLIYEQYQDAAALDAHRASPHFKTHASEGFFPCV